MPRVLGIDGAAPQKMARALGQDPLRKYAWCGEIVSPNGHGKGGLTALLLFTYMGCPEFDSDQCGPGLKRLCCNRAVFCKSGRTLMLFSTP